jgi:hypothetical protein
MISPLVGCSCKMDIGLHLRIRNYVGLNYDGAIHEKKLYAIMCYLKAWQHYLGILKTKFYRDNVSL